MSFWYLRFSQKTNEKIRLYYYGTYHSRIVLVRFLGELKTPKRHFEINWPLSYTINLVGINQKISSLHDHKFCLFLLYFQYDRISLVPYEFIINSINMYTSLNQKFLKHFLTDYLEDQWKNQHWHYQEIINSVPKVLSFFKFQEQNVTTSQ